MAHKPRRQEAFILLITIVVLAFFYFMSITITKHNHENQKLKKYHDLAVAACTTNCKMKGETPLLVDTYILCVKTCAEDTYSITEEEHTRKALEWADQFLSNAKKDLQHNKK